MTVLFQAIEEAQPGDRWRAEVQRLLPAYRQWFLKQGDEARPTYMACLSALRDHMPEIVPTYETLVELAGGGDLAARLLSLYCPTPYLTGCSQAVWLRKPHLLVRNYDYSPQLWDAVLWHTAWNGRRVIGMSDCLWGVLDGMNESGLAVSLAFGGRKIVGDGFGIPLVLRYVLEFCDDVPAAVDVLRRVPVNMAYNVTLIDRAGAHATVFVSPDREAAVTHRAVATNHQRVVEWRQFAHATASLDRERFLIARQADNAEDAEKFINRFQQPPIYSSRFALGWGTLYTAVYRPGDAVTEYRWPETVLEQRFDGYRQGKFTLTFPGVA